MNPLTCSFRAVRWGVKGSLWALVVYVVGFLVSFGSQQAEVAVKAASWPAPAYADAREVVGDGRQSVAEGIGNAYEWAREDVEWSTIGISMGVTMSLILGLWTTLHMVRRNRERDARDRQRDEKMLELVALMKSHPFVKVSSLS